MLKTQYFPSLLPLSVRSTISADIPRSNATHTTCENWLKIYNSHIYRNSLFFKGPLLSATSKIDKKSPTCKPCFP